CCRRAVRACRRIEFGGERAPARLDRRPQRSRYPGERRGRRALRRAHEYPRDAGAQAARVRAPPGGCGPRASPGVVAVGREVANMDRGPAAIESYCEAHPSAPARLLGALQAYSTRNGAGARMVVGPLEAALRQLLVRLTGARRVLEIGTF